MKRVFLKSSVGEYGVIINKKKEFLVLSLAISKKFPNEAWMLPGGRLEVNDQPEQGLRREIYEETGLKVKVVSPCHVARWGMEKPPKYVVFFLCRLAGDQEVKLSHEHANYKWVSLGDIEKIPFHNINSKLAIQKSFYNIKNNC